MKHRCGILVSLLSACAADPASVSVDFSWGPAGPPTEPGATLFVRVGELPPDGADRAELGALRTVSAARPTPAVATPIVTLAAVPVGERRVVVVEVRETAALESELLRYGVSQPFSIRPGETTRVRVEAALRRPPSARDGLLVAGSSTAALVRDPVVSVTLRAAGSARAELSSFETFPSASTKCFGLAGERAGCTTLSRSCPEADCPFVTPWDVNTGYEDDCGVDPGRGLARRDSCPRRVYARFFDENGVVSPTTSVDVLLDTRAPALEAASLDYGPSPTSLLGRVGAAQRGASVSIAFVASEPLGAAPTALRARAPSGAALRLDRLESSTPSLTLRYEATIAEDAVEGSYALEPVTLVDRAGNTATVTLALPSLEVRVSTPTLSIQQARLSYARAPAKNDRPEARGPYTIPAGTAYFALGPADPLDGAATLPADTFTLGAEAPSALRVFGDASKSSLLLPLVTPAADGRWPRERLRLPNLDAPRVYVTGIDLAGNESAPVLVENVWYLRSTAERDGRLAYAGATEDPRFPRSPEVPLLDARADADALDGASMTRGAAYGWTTFGGVLPDYFGYAAAYDAARGQFVFLSYFNTLETWTWTGGRFENATRLGAQLNTPSLPALVYDAGRARVVALDSGVTHEWDGTRWTEVVTRNRPSENGWCSMAYDSVRGRVVLVTINQRGDRFASTWTYDGHEWTDVSPPNSPPARSGPSVAFDEARGVVLMTDGAVGFDRATGQDIPARDTWTWDGQQWTEVQTPLGRPRPRSYGSMAYDPRRQRVVLQGGAPPDAILGNVLSDTWEWDGSRWTEVITNPPGPEVGMLAFDPRRGSLVSFGSTNVGAETPGNARVMAFDGAEWRTLTSTVIPPYASALAYDRARDRVVLANPDLGTWELEGERWTRTSTFSPTTPAQDTMVNDTARGQLLLLRLVAERNQGVRTYRYDTWAYHDRRWRRLAVDGPPPRLDGSLGYDEARGQAVLFGGGRLNASGELVVGDTWTFDGVAWSPAASAAPRMASAMGYDPRRQRLVRYGGWTSYINLPKSTTGVRGTDTWEWDGAAWTEVTPPDNRTPEWLTQDQMNYDPILERVVRSRFGAYAWAWDGARWQDVSPPNRGLAPAGWPAAADGRGIVVVNAADAELGHTFRMEAVTPQLTFRARAPLDVALSDVQDVRVRVFCSAQDPVAGSGARLIGWSGLQWETLAAGDAPFDVTIGPRWSRFVAGSDGLSFLACRADADAPSPRSEVALDYGEVWYRYRARP